MAKKKTAKKSASKKQVTKRRVARKTLVVKKKADKKKPGAQKKIVVRKKAAKKPAVEKKVVVKQARAKKKPELKKKTIKKKVQVRKKPARKAVVVAEEKPAAKKPPTKKPPTKKPARRRGRVTKMTAPEAMISLVTLADRWEDLRWLEALYLYGSNLGSAAGHRELRFMVIFKGLRQATQQRAAEKELDKLLKPVIPVRRRLDFLNDLEIIVWVEQDNPAFVAAFGQAIPIYVRHPS